MKHPVCSHEKLKEAAKAVLLRVKWDQVYNSNFMLHMFAFKKFNTLMLLPQFEEKTKLGADEDLLSAMKLARLIGDLGKAAERTATAGFAERAKVNAYLRAAKDSTRGSTSVETLLKHDADFEDAFGAHQAVTRFATSAQHEERDYLSSDDEELGRADAAAPDSDDDDAASVTTRGSSAGARSVSSQMDFLSFGGGK